MNSKTAFYILKRILLAILTVWIVITVTFFVMHAVPGGPFLSEKATPLPRRLLWKRSTVWISRFSFSTAHI